MLAARAEFIRFGVVGTLGFCWDTITVYSLRHLIGLYAAGACGFLVAATANWALNRVWTFQGRAYAPAAAQWAKFIAANLAGFVVNRGLFFVLVANSAVCRAQPVLAIMAGSLAGLFLNYFLSKRLVFR